MMNTKEKILSLEKYLTELKNRLNSPTPDKHKNRDKEFREFLNREIRKTFDKVCGLRQTAGIDK